MVADDWLSDSEDSPKTGVDERLDVLYGANGRPQYLLALEKYMLHCFYWWYWSWCSYLGFVEPQMFFSCWNAGQFLPLRRRQFYRACLLSCMLPRYVLYCKPSPHCRPSPRKICNGTEKPLQTFPHCRSSPDTISTVIGFIFIYSY